MIARFAGHTVCTRYVAYDTAAFARRCVNGDAAIEVIAPACRWVMRVMTPTITVTNRKGSFSAISWLSRGGSDASANGGAGGGRWGAVMRRRGHTSRSSNRNGHVTTIGFERRAAT